MEIESREIDEGTGYTGYHEAFDMITSHVPLVGTEEILLDLASGRIAASDLVARVSYPQTDVSLKDGVAVRSEDIAEASSRRKACLKVAGSVFAGGGFEGKIGPGQAVKICSGATIPQGADAVVSVEFCQEIP
jgi:molybdopterin molybdotransferase